MVLFPRNRTGESFFTTHPPALVESVSKYIFLISKKKQEKIKTETKEPKEEKRISPENRLPYR